MNSMKKQLLLCFFALSVAGLWPSYLSAQTLDAGQSTQGTDFWLTLMRSDANDPTELSLRIATTAETTVTIANPYTGYSHTMQLGANELGSLVLDKNDCYVGDAENEVVSQRALHVTATAPISLIAANYRDKSFDVAAILPTSSLKDEYRIQCYTPSDHSNNYQGSHFAIIATEDNTVVDYCPTVLTAKGGFTIGDTLTTPVLQRGEVFYVWTGLKEREAGDLSGTYVKAQAGKPIAVFNGNPHTNIPYEVRDRDHLYSQAMPIVYWGTQFAATASMTRRRDKFRVQALYDGTELRINGELVHTFDFSTNPKHYYEFELGSPAEEIVDKDGNIKANDGSPVVVGTSCWIETTCPAAVHLFMVSNRYDYPIDPYCDGDPSMIWINPIEQQINDITFGTFQTAQVDNHYLNIVTTAANAASVTLDGVSISADFQPLSGNTNYVFARKQITNATHQLQAANGFIAHVYGYGEKESYGYPAGGATKPLTSSITINGEEFTAESDNLLCGEDTIHFGCSLNFEFEQLVWGFGDGTTYTTTGPDSVSRVDHYYSEAGLYHAYALIYRSTSDLCGNESAVDSIPIRVNIGRFVFGIGTPDIPCQEDGKPFVGTIPFTNESGIDLTDGSTTIEYNDAATQAGFRNEELVIEDNAFRITIPTTAETAREYGIHIRIDSECGGTDTTLYFMLSYDKDVLTQRFDNVLGLMAEPFAGNTLSDFQWYRTSDSTAIEGQVNAVLNWHDVDFDHETAYYLCFTLNKGTETELQTCTCAKSFADNSDTYRFEEDSTITLSGYSAPAGSLIYVNAQGASTAQWITVSGEILREESLPDGGRTLSVPDDEGFYLLRVLTDGKARNFKFLVTR